MVTIYKDKHSEEFVIQTTCLDTGAFIADLAEALGKAKHGGEELLAVLTNAMPIAFKLSGYKADNVNERRTLVCGFASPESCDVVASGGK